LLPKYERTQNPFTLLSSAALWERLVRELKFLVSLGTELGYEIMSALS